jgi:malate/lactate dehydrogenase
MSGQSDHTQEVAMFNFLKHNLKIFFTCARDVDGNSQHAVALYLTNPVNKQSVKISSDSIYLA